MPESVCVIFKEDSGELLEFLTASVNECTCWQVFLWGGRGAVVAANVSEGWGLAAVDNVSNPVCPFRQGLPSLFG